MMTRKHTVLIVDDHPLFREGLKSLIDRSSGYEVIGEAGSGEEALRMARSLRPDLVTMDVSLPQMSGIDCVRHLVQLFPQSRVLVVSMHAKFDYIAEAFRAGAKGYLVKDSASGRLIEALDALSRGDSFLDGNVSHEVVAKILAGAESETAIHDEKYGLLTPREQQVMRLVVEGVTSREIAEKLSLSPKTVENHRANLMKKLDVHNRMELVRYAARLGLIDVEQWIE
ncbi:response regulator transcription factor [Desulfuromonas sp.]|uniref:response regulator n=1 Tax=Desulfuromonas sp. TaxID=892 RepID=UPI0025BDE781|nr:response regulator transcription factor [Desulfuromonas sp.]